MSVAHHNVYSWPECNLHESVQILIWKLVILHDVTAWRSEKIYHIMDKQKIVKFLFIVEGAIESYFRFYVT